METLLGHLAQFGSFFAQGEVLCTQGLAYLLQDPRARSTFAAKITSLTGVDLGMPLTWQAEAHQDDKGRPDLEARTYDDVPRVKIEAKLGAPFGEGQLQSYAAHLHNRSAEGVLLVLVPRHRTGEAAAEVATAFGLSGSGPWPPTEDHHVAIAVVSWDEVLAVLGEDGSERFLHELEQFEEMYRVLSGDTFPPLAGLDDLIHWRTRENDFTRLVERVTRRLTTHHRLYPMGVETLEQAPEARRPDSLATAGVSSARWVPRLDMCFRGFILLGVARRSRP